MRGRTQRGAALVIALLMLVLMTIVGVSVMSTTNLQQRMSANLYDSNIAFQAAENQLREAERQLLTAANPNGLVDEPETNIGDFIAAEEWGRDEASGDRGSADFVIGPPRVRTLSAALGSEQESLCFFPVAAWGRGGTDEAVAVIREWIHVGDCNMAGE